MVFCFRCWDITSHLLTMQENTLRIFTFSDLQEAIEKFIRSSESGDCGFGSAHMGMVTNLTYPNNNINVVVKPVKRAKMGKRRLEAELRRFANINHQNLVKLIGYCDEDSLGSEMYLVYEYLPNRSLDLHLSSLPWSMRLQIAKDAATALACLHEQMIIFKDFKPSNILLDNRMKAKLRYVGHFREAHQDGQTSQTGVATHDREVGRKGYTAPEYVQKGILTTKMDVWSYGIFLQELITGESSIPIVEENLENNHNPECMRWVCCYAGAGLSKLIVDPMLEGKYSEKSMQKVASIANKCLVLEPQLRPNMSLVLELVKKAIDLEISTRY